MVHAMSLSESSSSSPSLDPALHAPSAEERALVALVRTGDVDAFARLVGQHLPSVTRVAFWWTRSHDTAEDIAQRVFVRIWDHRAALDPERPIKPYLLRAVRNLVVDDRRSEVARQLRHEAVAAERGVSGEDAHVPSPENAILETATVYAALDQLPARRQLVLRLWLKEELSIAEIADVLGVSLQAADRLLRRAQADLRAVLGVPG